MLLAIRQGARRIWTAIRTSGWLQALRALTAFGQWGLLIGLGGSTLLVTAALGRVLPASILPVKDALTLASVVGWLPLLVLGPLTLWSSRTLLRRVSAVSAGFALRRRVVRRRAWILAVSAFAIPAGLIVAVDRSIGTILVNWIFVYLGGKGEVPILLVMAALVGGIFGLSRRARRWLFGLGVVGFLFIGFLGLLGPWPEAARGRQSVVSSLGPGQREDLEAFLLMTFVYLAVGLGCLIRLPRPAPAVSSGPAAFPFSSLMPPVSSSPPVALSPVPSPPPVTLPPVPPLPPPPPRVTVPRNPRTGMVRRHIDL